MADWLVIEDYSLTPVHLVAGSVISDTQYNIPLLRGQGLAAVEWKDPLKTAFQSTLDGYRAYRAQKPNSPAPDADLSALLSAYMQQDGGGGGGEANTSSNAGGGAGLALPKSGVNLPFRTLISSDSSVAFDVDADTVDLSAAGEANTTSNEGGGAALALPKSGVNLPFRTLTSNSNSVQITEDADTIDLGVFSPGQSGHAQLSFGNAAGGPNANISLAGAALSRLPPAAQTPAPFTTAAGPVSSIDWEVPAGSNGALRYIGSEAGRLYAVTATITIRRDGSAPDKDLFLYANKAAAPSSATVENATRQGIHADNGDEAYSVTLHTIVAMSPNELLELWVGAEGGGAPFVFQVQGYALTVTSIAPGG